MPSLPTGINEADRATRAWLRIQRWPTSIVIERGGTLLSAQTVRVEFSTQQIERTGQGQNVMPSQKDVVIFGVRNHPNDSVVDTNLRRQDRFVINNSSYQIVDVNDVVPGEIQADAVRTS